MGVIVIEGLVIAALVLTGFREAVLNAIPMELKRAIGIGIGLFIAFIGLVDAGIVIHPEAGTPIVTLNPDLTTLPILTFAIGLAITAALVARRMKGALLLGIIATTVVAAIVNAFADTAVFPPGVATWPDKVVDAPDFSLVGNFSLDLFNGDTIAFATAIALILSVMLSDFFDTMGTVIGVGSQAGFVDAEGNLPRLYRVLLVDSLAAAWGGFCGGSSTTTYVESAAGVGEGGRTGLVGVVVAALFLVALFFSPIVGIVPAIATAPVLIVVGFLMISVIKDISFDDIEESFPAFLILLVMPLTLSISHGIGYGFIAYTAIKLLRGKLREVHPLMAAVSVLFAVSFALQA
jgi:AGZA family xanthine/uracil permease-like MFS transporter